MTSREGTYVTCLRCLRCGAERPADPHAGTCPSCTEDTTERGILDVEYDLAAAARAWRNGGRSDPRGIARFAPLLPLGNLDALPVVGGTPLIEAPALANKLGLKRLAIKNEGANPSGCLKDRASAVAVAMAVGCGAHDVGCASAGNAAISLANLSRPSGLAAHVFVPDTAGRGRWDQLARLGADVRIVPGDYDAAYDEAERCIAQSGWFSRNCAYNPYLVEGKKTVSFEIHEQLGVVPDLVVSPVGDGCTLSAIGKGFEQLLAMGMIDRLPRLVGVQASGVQPLVRRYRGESTSAAGTTRASSIAVGRPRNGLRLMRALEKSGGTMVAVSDDTIASAQAELECSTGLGSELASAAALAGLRQLALGGALGGQSAVIVLTARRAP